MTSVWGLHRVTRFMRVSPIGAMGPMSMWEQRWGTLVSASTFVAVYTFSSEAETR